MLGWPPCCCRKGQTWTPEMRMASARCCWPSGAGTRGTLQWTCGQGDVWAGPGQSCRGAASLPVVTQPPRAELDGLGRLPPRASPTPASSLGTGRDHDGPTLGRVVKEGFLEEVPSKLSQEGPEGPWSKEPGKEKHSDTTEGVPRVFCGAGVGGRGRRRPPAPGCGRCQAGCRARSGGGLPRGGADDAGHRAERWGPAPQPGPGAGVTHGLAWGSRGVHTRGGRCALQGRA